jgi:hypothetical protein
MTDFEKELIIEIINELKLILENKTFDIKQSCERAIALGNILLKKP